MTRNPHRSESTAGNAMIKTLLFLLAVAMVGSIAFAWGVATIENKSFPYALIRGDADANTPRAMAARRAPQNALWAKNVVKGGYILHFRHAQREKWNDVTGFDAHELLNKIDASTASFYKATCLTPQGEEESKLIGALFKDTGVKISQVLSSPSCRARQTAMLAFGRIDGIENALLHRTAIVHEQHEAAAKRLRKVLDGLNPPKGQNIALAGHGNTLSYDGAIVIDVDRTEGIDDRDETGFIVIEKKDGKLIAQHRFKSIAEFANAIMQLPVAY
jgi:phosphohistidine phosphatase SixA